MKDIQTILPYVETPGRYIGAEANTIKKNHQQIPCKIVLAFPDMYEIGTSHMGVQVLYHIINQHPKALAERVFAPAPDMAVCLKNQHVLLPSLETKTSLQQFDIIGFSLLYELNYTNILSMLDLAQIPFYSSERENNFPLIIAGGPCACNPEPMSDFFDAIVIGDGEQVIIQMIDIFLDHDPKDRHALLKSWSKLDSVYIPQFYDSIETTDRTMIRKPIDSNMTPIKRVIVCNLDQTPFPDQPVVAVGKPVHDRYSLEIARGCTRGCRFCQAGMIYRPVRERAVDTLLQLAEKALPSTGYDEISLLSLSSGDFSCISTLMAKIMSYCHQENIAVSLPSLRAGTLTPELMEIIKTVRKTGFTIAPEAGSDRLRKVINKNITEDQIVDTVTQAFEMGWRLIKLYFMIGLPTETPDDREEMIHLVKRLRHIIKKFSPRAQLNVSVSTFIPKPHTPFQWCEQISLASSEAIIAYLKDQLNIKGIRFKWQDPYVSFMEGIWSRGDRRLSKLLVEAYHLGCQFDGWSDRFRFDLWQQAFENSEINVESFLSGYSMSASLPWDHIDIRVDKSFLMNEFQKAHQEEQTGDCKTEKCNRCGCCDFKEIQPISGYPAQTETLTKTKSTDHADFQKILFTYAKRDNARFLGHLELVTIIIRAFRRAGYRFEHSQGFHPMPKISFTNPLPLGMESEAECFVASLFEIQNPSNIIDRDCLPKLNAQLPDGLRFTTCETVISKNVLEQRKTAQIAYQMFFSADIDSQKIDDFMLSETFIIHQKNRKGKISSMDLKQKILRMERVEKRQLNCWIDNSQGKIVRPKVLLVHVLGLNDDAVKSVKIVKRN